MGLIGLAGSLLVAAVAAAFDGEGKWPDVRVEYYDSAKDPMCAMKGAYFRGGYVSAKADVADARASRFFLRRNFTLDQSVAEAWLQGIGDERAIFRINGHEVFRTTYIYQNGGPGNHTAVAKVGVFLKRGENTLEVEYAVSRSMEYGMGRRFPGGAVCELLVRQNDGTFVRIDSDERFRSSVDGREWTDVAISAPPPAAPHPCRLEYVDFANRVECRSGGPVRQEACRGEKVRFDYRFSGPKPEGEFTLRTELRNGESLHWSCEVDVSGAQAHDDGTWSVAFDYELPLFIRPGKYRFSAMSNSLYAEPSAMDAGITIRNVPGVTHDGLAAEMKTRGGQPAVVVNGRPTALLWGGVSHFKRAGGIPRHSDMPLNVVVVRNDYQNWHPAYGRFDFGHLDQVAEMYRRQNPTAYLLFDLTVFPPDDFAKRHPEEMSADDEGNRTPVDRFSYSYASGKAVEEMREMVEKAVRYIEESPYADRVIGYRVNSGVTMEWLGWTARNGHVKDFSDVNRRAFAAFAEARYPGLKDPHVPTLDERTELDAADDILWNRERHLNAIAYNEYDSWIIQKDLLELCGCAKDVLKSMGRTKLVGTYYGYTCYLNADGSQVWRGHFALNDLLRDNSGRVDFLMSPQNYGVRRLGDSCGDMKPFATLHRAGIMSVIEEDTRTHSVYKPDYYGFNQTLNAGQTDSVIRRNGSIALCRRTSPYFFALSNGVDYDYPGSAAIGADLLKALNFATDRNVGRHAEVALVFSEKSVCAMPRLDKLKSPKNTGVGFQNYAYDGRVTTGVLGGGIFHSEVFMRLQARFLRCGAPVDFVLAEDLARDDGNYRLYVFLDQMVYDEDVLMAVRRIQSRGAACCWIYAPGYMKDGTLASMKELTGIGFAECRDAVQAKVKVMEDSRWMGMQSGRVAKMFVPLDADKVLGTYDNGQAGLAVKRVGESVNFFSGTWQLDLAFIRQMVKTAGIFAYSESGDPVEACDAFVTLHARTAGTKRIRLPRKTTVVDVFGHRLVARDVDAFEFEAGLHSSWLFCCDDNAEELLK